MMAIGLIESAFVENMLDDPKKLEFLCEYLLSDPRYLQDSKEIN